MSSLFAPFVDRRRVPVDDCFRRLVLAQTQFRVDDSSSRVPRRPDGIPGPHFVSVPLADSVDPLLLHLSLLLCHQTCVCVRAISSSIHFRKGVAFIIFIYQSFGYIKRMARTCFFDASLTLVMHFESIFCITVPMGHWKGTNFFLILLNGYQYFIFYFLNKSKFTLIKNV